MEQLINDFSPGLFIMQSILMLVVIFIMVKFAWKPIVSSLDEREEGIKKALESAELAKAEMQNISSANEQLMKEAREEREQLEVSLVGQVCHRVRDRARVVPARERQQ